MLKSYIKGALSFAIPIARNSHADIFSVSAEFSYSQFMRHLVLRERFSRFTAGESVAELGPGSSLGFGLSALLAGADHYLPFDVVPHFDITTNLRIFSGLVQLFRARAVIPHTGEYSRLFPFLGNYDFPNHLTSRRLADALSDDRVSAIEADIRTGGGRFIAPFSRLKAAGVVDQVDWIASHSVLEHIDNPAPVIASLGKLLKSTGVMTHLVDFGSHGLTREWNGHWAINALQWKILRGRRTYLINRLPAQAYLDVLKSAGITVLECNRFLRVDGLLAQDCIAEWRNLADLDARTHMAFLICYR